MNWETDEQLADDLAAAMRAEREVPGRFVAAGKAAFAWRTVDAELATLSFDSTRDNVALPGTRADHASVRTVTFSAGEISIDVELTPTALLGQVVPAQPGELELSVRDGSTQTTAVDDVGWFAVRPRPSDTFRLTFRAPGRPAVVTEWIAP